MFCHMRVCVKAKEVILPLLEDDVPTLEMNESTEVRIYVVLKISCLHLHVEDIGDGISCSSSSSYCPSEYSSSSYASSASWEDDAWDDEDSKIRNETTPEVSSSVCLKSNTTTLHFIFCSGHGRFWDYRGWRLRVFSRCRRLKHQASTFSLDSKLCVFQPCMFYSCIGCSRVQSCLALSHANARHLPAFLRSGPWGLGGQGHAEILKN